MAKAKKEKKSKAPEQPQGMPVNPNELLTVIGEKEVQIIKLRQAVQVLAKENTELKAQLAAKETGKKKK